MPIVNTNGIDPYTGAFLLSCGLVFLLITYLIQKKIGYIELYAVIGFLLGTIITSTGVAVLFLCLVMKFFG